MLTRKIDTHIGVYNEGRSHSPGWPTAPAGHPTDPYDHMVAENGGFEAEKPWPFGLTLGQQVKKDLLG